MTDPTDGSSFAALPEPRIDPPRRRWPSVIWVVPILAALVGLSLVVQAVMQRGPVITVAFSTADGIEPGKTKVKYKAVDIGEVRTVRLTEDRSKVMVTIDLVKEAGQFAVADTRFWVVRPRFAGTGVSGLGTLLSGSYIAIDVGRSDERQTEFTGLEEPPVVASDQAGRRFTLETDDIGSLDVGSPVYFRHIPVGDVEQFTLAPDGRKITVGVFIKSPYDHFVTADSRFWHASGVDISVDSNGLKLQTQSLATILLGGIAFDTPSGAEKGQQVASGATFVLASDFASAAKAPDGKPVELVLRFRQSVRGLSIGAPVNFRGIDLGYVRAIGLSFDPVAEEFSSPVRIELYPDRLAAAGAAFGSPDNPAGQLALVGELVRRGLRAQLQSGNLLTGQLYVALDFFPTAPAITLDTKARPLELPTVASDLEELRQQVQTILHQVEQIPFDTLGQDAHRVLVGLDTSLKRIDTLTRSTNADILPEIRNSLQEMTRTMQTMQATLAADAPMQQDSRQALHGVADAARSLKALADTLDRHPESLIQGRTGANR
jgi:paraquat-inducible protein B